MWIDENCVDGVVDGVVSTDVDDIVGCNGFSEALVSVEWLKTDDDKEVIEIPHFASHNGESAKKRGLKNKRQTKWRQHRDDLVDGDASTTASPEKRREEKSKDNTHTQAREKSKAFVKPTIQELTSAFNGKVPDASREASKFLNFYESKGWKIGKNPMKSWPHAVGNWAVNCEGEKNAKRNANHQSRTDQLNESARNAGIQLDSAGEVIDGCFEHVS